MRFPWIGNTVVDVWVGPVQVAQGALQSMGRFLEEEPVVLATTDQTPAHCETQLEGHIEARDHGARRRQLNAAEIVD